MTGAESAPGGDKDFSAEDCRAQLARILNSTEFDATDRERRFLDYVVDETLAGRSHRIKAYSIAVEVFGRDASFDPQIDPIVRVQAGHLRRAIERYYLTAGQGDPVRITIPKGGYVPYFSVRPTPSRLVDKEPVVAPVPTRSLTHGRSKTHLVITAVALAIAAAAIAYASWGIWQPTSPNKPEVPHLLVEWFDDLNGTGESAALARGLTQEIVSQLAHVKDIVVVQSRDPAAPALTHYVLAGSVALSNHNFRFRVRMLNRMDGSVLWAQSYDGATTAPDLLKVQSDIAHDVATSVAQSYGAIFQVGSQAAVQSSADAP